MKRILISLLLLTGFQLTMMAMESQDIPTNKKRSLELNTDDAQEQDVKAVKTDKESAQQLEQQAKPDLYIAIYSNECRTKYEQRFFFKGKYYDSGHGGPGHWRCPWEPTIPDKKFENGDTFSVIKPWTYKNHYRQQYALNVNKITVNANGATIEGTLKDLGDFMSGFKSRDSENITLQAPINTIHFHEIPGTGLIAKLKVITTELSS
jgi:hypothetical protein